MKNIVSRSRLFGYFLLLIAVLLTGCPDKQKPDEKSPARIVPVSGVVMIDGNPLPNALVQVAPYGHQAAHGKTDAEGRFTLSTHTEGDGCLEGTHSVAIIAVEYIEDADTGEDSEVILHVPEKYLDIETTDYMATIDGPTDDLRIELQWGDQQGPIRREMPQ